MQVESHKPIILLHDGKLQHCSVDEYVAPTTPTFKLLNLAQPNQEVNKTVTSDDVGHEYRIRHDNRNNKIYIVVVKDEHVGLSFSQLLDRAQSVWTAQGEDFPLWRETMELFFPLVIAHDVTNLPPENNRRTARGNCQ